MIKIIGISNPALLPAHLREAIEQSDVLVGGARHLATFLHAGRRRIVIDANIDVLLERLQQEHAAGSKIVVLASGDPLWYGIGTTLRRVFAPEDLEVIPAPSAAQMAFAALAEPWHDALLLSAHGRPIEPVVERMLAELRRTAILTDDNHTPNVIAARLLAEGYPDCSAAVCENLGLPGQRIVRAALREIAEQDFASLNVLVVLPDGASFVGSESAAGQTERPFGLYDDQLEHDGLITHLEVRAVSLAALTLRPADIVWDVGSGSGAVALEAARVAWRGEIFAIERDLERMQQLRRNLVRWGDRRIWCTHGTAPEACEGWPDADAIFIGGSNGRLDELLRYCAGRLRPGGRLVVNLVTLELVGPALQLMHELALNPTVRQIAVSRSHPLRGQTYLRALNPVYVLSGTGQIPAAPDTAGHASASKTTEAN